MRLAHLGYVSCGKCERQLVGERSEKAVWAITDRWPIDLDPPVFIRVAGRPYCETCGRLAALRKAKPKPEM